MLAISSICLVNSLLMIMFSHPLSMGLALMIQTLCITILSSMFYYNYWFSYILFLIMIGGMLILFLYMTSVASNEKFKFSYKIFTLISLLLLIIPTTLMINYQPTINLLNMNLYNQSTYLNNYVHLTKFINAPMLYSLLFIMIYLLMTMIATVKITEMKQGPLRQKF